MSVTSKKDVSLSSERRELLARLLKERGIAETAIVPEQAIRRTTQNGRIPLALNQEGLWFIEQLEPGKGNHNIPGTVRLTGRLDVSALEKSLSAIVQRHETLRTTFKMDALGKPFQKIEPITPLKLPLIDLSNLPSAQREAEAKRHALNEAIQAFDLSSQQPFRTKLMRLDQNEHVLLVNFHHIAADGWSMGIFADELVKLYTAFVSGKPPGLAELPIQFSDFAIWQREKWQGDVLKNALVYWRRQLQDLPLLRLPTDRPRPEVQSYRGKHASVAIDQDLSEAVRGFTRKAGATLYMTLMAVFNVLLHHLSKQEDIVVGSTFANRNYPELEKLIGFFVNTLPLRTDLKGNPTFKDLLGRVRHVTLGASAHQELPLAKLVNEIQSDRDLGRNPMYQVVFDILTPDHNPALFGYGLSSTVRETLSLPDLQVTPMDVEGGIARFDIAVFIWDQPDGLAGTFEYSTDLFDSSTIVNMIENFSAILSLVIKKPEIRLDALSEFLQQANKQRSAALDGDYQNTIHNKLKNIRRRPVRH